MGSKQKNCQILPDFEFTEILSKTDSSLNHSEAYYLFELARKTHGTGDLVHIGNLRNTSLYCLAAAARAWGGTVSVIDVHHEKLRHRRDLQGDKNKEMFLPDSLRELGLDRYVEKINYDFSSSDCSTHIDCIVIDGCLEREPLIKSILTWKNHLSRDGVIVINKAQDGGQVDQDIDESLCSDSAFIEIQGTGRIRGFTRRPDKMEMILCSGLQSGGTTLVSWCFLQRPDMSGILDMWTEVLLLMPYVNTQYGWCKMTTSCFRWQDVADFYADQGWNVRPLLVVRDVRSAYTSLRVKPYGLNGVTAEDPPLRMRFRRFLRDWEEFRARGWPIIRFESFLANPVVTLKDCCKKLEVPWYEDMVVWPKSVEDISGVEHANETFHASLGGEGLLETIKPNNKLTELRGVSQEDLRWLEEVFYEYNQENDYPSHVEPVDVNFLPDRPNWFVTKRHEQALERADCQRRISRCNESLQAVMDSKSWRLTAPLRYVGGFFLKRMARQDAQNSAAKNDQKSEDV